MGIRDWDRDCCRGCFNSEFVCHVRIRFWDRWKATKSFSNLALTRLGEYISLLVLNEKKVMCDLVLLFRIFIHFQYDLAFGCSQ